MSATEVSADGRATSTVGWVDMKPEVVVIPVRDVDPATQFYDHLGWRPDSD